MEILDKAKGFVKQDRPDVAAVFFAAAAQQPSLSASAQFAANRNACLLAERAAERRYGCTAAEFIGDERHEVVCKAIAAAVTARGGGRVLMLGSALGAYALAAKQAGATDVVCREFDGFCEYIATYVAREYELDGVAISTSLPQTSCAQEDQRFDVLVVAECFWGSNANSKALADCAAARPLLKSDAKIVPESVSFWAQAIESEMLRNFNAIDVDKFKEESGLDYSKYNEAVRRSRMATHLVDDRGYRALSAPFEWLVLELQSQSTEAIPVTTNTATLTIESDGRLDSVVTWTSMRLSADADALQWGPGTSGRSAWVYVHYPDLPEKVSSQDKIDVPLTFTPKGPQVVGLQSPGDALAISPYHTSMLAADPQRLKAYRHGIQKAVQALHEKRNGGAVNVLDIGAGTGLLSCFAASAGATVLACERDQCMAKLAQKIIDDNQVALAAGSITVVNSNSTDLSNSKENIPKPDLIVSEILGTDPLSETVLPVLRHAAEKLAGGSTDFQMLPCRCRLWGAVAQCPAEWESRTIDACFCGIDFGAILAPFESGIMISDLRTEFPGIVLHTPPTVLVTHSLVPPIRDSGSWSTTVSLLEAAVPLFELLKLPPPATSTATVSCDALCIVLWWDADCTPEPVDDLNSRISTSPEVVRSPHWSQFAFILDPDRMGDGVEEAVASHSGSLVITTTWTGDRTNFNIEVATQAH